MARQLALEAGALVSVTGRRPNANSPTACAAMPRIPMSCRWPACCRWESSGRCSKRLTCSMSNNSGPVHIAAALGTPVVDLYALTNPQHTPWQVPHRTLFEDVPCRHCYKSTCPQGHHRCLRGVSPAAVIAAAQALLGGEGGADDRMPWMPDLNPTGRQRRRSRRSRRQTGVDHRGEHARCIAWH
ncbi:glycosyltransferase family 9 protein [Cupriavidus basilensis]